MNNRSAKATNLDLYDPAEKEGPYDLPIVRPYTGNIPETFLPFDRANTYGGDRSAAAVHFYIEDEHFERVWNSPSRYINLLRQYGAVVGPDFKVIPAMPTALQIWNTYRQRLLSQYLQKNGVKVIPSVSYAGVSTARFYCDGLPKESVIAVTCKGWRADRDSWTAGVREMCRFLQPSRLLIFGATFALELPGVELQWVSSARRAALPQAEPRGPRTLYLLDHPEIARCVGAEAGIAPEDWEDFYQDIILASMLAADGYNPDYGAIVTWATNFARLQAKTFRRRYRRREALLTHEEIDARIL